MITFISFEFVVIIFVVYSTDVVFMFYLELLLVGHSKGLILFRIFFSCLFRYPNRVQDFLENRFMALNRAFLALMVLKVT
jgi:hypothetical protein